MKYLCGNSYTVNKNPKHINMLRVYFTENVFSHPDYHRRYRNYTGSVPKGSRGLSPPVGIYTLP